MATHPPDRVAIALNAVERLMRIYRFERAIFLIGAAGGMLLLVYAAFLTLQGGKYDKESLGYFFGAGGAFATAGGYVLWLLNKSFDLIRDIILGPTPQDDGS